MPVESGGASSLPLPSGASTLAEQQTHTTRLGTISTNTGDAASDTDAIRLQTDDLETITAAVRDRLPTSTGAKTAALSLAVVLPSDFTTLTDLLAYTRPQATAPTNLTPKTVPTGTAEAIAASTPATRYVRVTSDFANTKTVYVGRVGVTVANGQPLGPGDVYTNRDIDNANLLYCISADAAQVLRPEVL